MGLSQTEIDVLLKMRAEGAQSIDLFSGTLNKAGTAGETAAGGVDKASASMARSGAVATAAGVAIGEFATKVGEKLVELGKDTVLTAARTQGLSAVADFLGQRAGKTRAEVDDLVGSIKRQGVTTQEASNLVIQLSRANLGLENATKLATVAQNGAFIAGESTAEALQQIITGIVTLQPELIRSAGITVSLQQAETEYAKKLHVSAESLTTAQKQQLLLNAVLKEGQNINGVYALSMQYVGKQLTSLPRYIEEAKNSVGNELLPVLGLAVTVFTDFLKIITAHPAVFVDLGIAVTAVVAPLLAAKAAAFLGIPTFAQLAVSVTSASSALTILGAVRNFGDLRAGIQLLGESAGLTFSKLGFLGSAAAIAGAAFAGWEFGRWIAGLTGMDDRIASLAAKLLGFGNVAKEEAAAGQDAINFAMARGGKDIHTAAQALEYNTGWVQRHTAELINDQAALERLAADARMFTADMDGVSIRVGTATDSLHKFWDELYKRQLQVPKINIPLPGHEKGLTLDPGKDASSEIAAMLSGTTAITKTVEERSLAVSNALARIGSDIGKVKKALDDHNISAKDLVDIYGITQETANALTERFKNEAEAAKKAAEAQKKWNAVVEEMESLGADYHKTLEELDASTLQLARDALTAGADHQALAQYYGLTKTQLAALVKEHEEYEKVLKKIQKIEEEIRTGGYQSILAIDPSGRARANAEIKALADMSQAYVDNANKTKALYVELNASIQHGAEDTASFQIGQVLRWQDAQEGALDYSVDNWREAYELIGAIARQKIEEIKRAHNPLFQAVKGALSQISSSVATNFAEMLTGAKTFAEGFTSIWESIKSSLINIFAEIAEYFIRQMLAKMILAAAASSGALAGGGGGGAGGWAAMAASVAGSGGVAGGGGGGGVAGSLVGGAGGMSGAGMAAAAGYGGIAVGGWMLGSWLGHYTENKTLGAAMGAGAGAAAGAAIGSVVPGLGTGIGAGVGAIAGAIAGWRAAGHLYEEVKQKREELEKNFGGVDGLVKSVGDAFHYVGKSGTEAEAALHQLWDAENVDEYNEALKKIGPVLEQYQREVVGLQTAQQYGLGLGSLHGDAFQHAFAAQLESLQKDKDTLEASGVSHSDILTAMAPKFNDLLAAALKAGEGIPPALKPILVELEQMGLLTEDNKNQLLGLVGASTVDFKALEGVAGRYGITLSQLGGRFQQAHVTDAATALMKDFKALVDAGADTDGVLSGMKDEIQEIVQASVKFGTTIPDSMRPLIEQLIRTGQLFDENGKAITDIGAIKFAAPLEKETDKIVDAINRLGDILTGKLPADAEKGATDATAALGRIRPPTIRVPYRYENENDIPPPNEPPEQPSGAASGIYANRPTLAIFGEGGEPELGGPRSFFRDVFSSLGFGARAATGEPAAAAPATGGGGDTYVFQVSVIDATDFQQIVEGKILPLIVNAAKTNRRQVRTDLVQALGVS